MPLRRFTASLFLLALGATPGIAQIRPDVFTIEGYVRDQSSQQGMESVLVSLKQATGTPLTTTYTRGNGEFIFDGLPSGEYAIEVNVREYESAREVVTISNVNRMGVFISLARKLRVPVTLMGATISAHQLSVPHKARDEFEKGVSLAALKSDYQGAIVEFQKAIKDFPAYYEAYAEEGDAYYRMGQTGPAEEALRKSVEVSSGQYADAAFTLAALLTDTNRFPDAEAMARQGMKTDTSSWRGPFELARALNALKKPEEAEKNAIQSRDLMPDNPAVYLLLANIHIQRKDLSALERDLNDYLRLAPNGPEADQARKTLEKIKEFQSSAKSETNEDEDDDASESNGKESRPSAKKDAKPQVNPDTSGLPSLPPPSAGNP